MSNVLLWFPRVALDSCMVNGKVNLIFKDKMYIYSLKVADV